MTPTNTFDNFLQRADYSLLDSLNADQTTEDGRDHRAREVLSGHYVPVVLHNPRSRIYRTWRNLV